MEHRASIPPGLPRATPTTSYWQSPPADIADLQSTENVPTDVDVVVIGSGISGATAAYNLLSRDPSLRILLLEARQAASGASGRNGGHTKHASYVSFPGNVEHDGAEDAIKIAELEYRCMVAIHDFIREHSIECDARRIDTVDVYFDESRWAFAEHAIKLMRELIGTESAITNYQFYSQEQTAAQFLTPRAVGSVKYEAGSLSAYKLTIGILRLALTKGLNLQTNTPATSIEKVTAEDNFTSWLVHTDRGTVKTSKLLLATNAHTAHLYPALRGVIVPLRGEVTAQRPGKNMPQKGLPVSYSLVYAKGFEYAITRPEGTEHEGDIVIGGGLTKGLGPDGLHEFGNTDDSTLDPQIATYLESSTVTFFSQQNWGDDHDDGRIRQVWSGIMGYSSDGHPFVGPVPGEPGLYLDASFQGHGMVLCFLCADAVAQMMLGQDGPDLAAWFPRCFRVTQERMTKKMGNDYQV